MSNKKKTQAESTENEAVETVVEHSAESQATPETTEIDVPHETPTPPNNDEVEQVEPVKTDSVKTETVIVKKGGTALALLALLVALGIGGAGYYFGQQEVNKIYQKFTAVEQQIAGTTLTTPQPAPEVMNFDQERAQIQHLLNGLKANDEKLSLLEVTLSDKERAYAALQEKVNKAVANSNAQPSDWLLSEADFLLTNALRKLLLDNDVDTSISLLKVADETLAKVTLPEVKAVRAAINRDLKQLLSVNSVDQNAIMQQLSQLANNVDELSVLNVNFENEQKQEKISDDVVNDWQTNLEKSANSFLNYFIRITPRSENATQALLAPNQDIYLRENIRLRLQIAILAVPRQQNELYKQSLETVAAWVRSYFDTNNETAANFLKSLDELAEQSIYIEVPSQLSSLNALDKLLNKAPQEVQKVEISADKALTEANQVAAEEIKVAEENKAPETPKVEETPADQVAPQPAEATPQAQ